MVYHLAAIADVKHVYEDPSPEEAAANVVAMYDDPWRWWESEEVREVRRTFVDRYALGREDWVDCWIKILREEMALNRVSEAK